MSTATAVETHLTEARTWSWSGLLAPLAGLALIAGMIALFVSPAGDDTGESPGDVVAYATSHEGWIVALGLFALATIVLAGAFVAGLHARLREVASSTESTMILIGGIAFALSLALSFIVWTGPLIDVPADQARALAQAEAYLAIDDIGWFLLGAAGIGAALMAVAASAAALRGRVVPGWLGWLGIAAGIASFATVAFFGMFAWMAWIAVASIAMLIGRR